MRGIARSIRYWIYNMEKTYGIMFLTVVAILVFQYMIGGKEVFYNMARMYFPMMGGIFLIAMLMSGANHYIPQSLSSGGTRRDVFAGMQVALHLMICQTLLVVFLYCRGTAQAGYMSEGFADREFFLGCMAIYLLFSGLGNLLCAGCLRFGTKLGMILYMIFVVVGATMVGVMMALDEEGTVAFLSLKGEHTIYAVAVTAAIDLLMMAVCYLAIRRYEVR